ATPVDRRQLAARRVHIAIFAAGHSLGVVLRVSVTHEVLDSHLKVKADLFIDVALDGAARRANVRQSADSWDSAHKASGSEYALPSSAKRRLLFPLASPARRRLLFPLASPARRRLLFPLASPARGRLLVPLSSSAKRRLLVPLSSSAKRRICCSNDLQD